MDEKGKSRCTYRMCNAVPTAKLVELFSKRFA
jgi:hypothetical protein